MKQASEPSSSGVFGKAGAQPLPGELPSALCSVGVYVEGNRRLRVSEDGHHLMDRCAVLKQHCGGAVAPVVEPHLAHAGLDDEGMERPERVSGKMGWPSSSTNTKPLASHHFTSP